MFKQPFFHSPPHGNSRRRERYSFPKGEGLATGTANAPVFCTAPFSPTASNNNSSPLWPGDGYRFGRTSRAQQQQSRFCQSTIRRTHNASWWARAPRSRGEEEEYIYGSNVVRKPLWNAYSEENSTDTAIDISGWDSKQAKSDNDTVTTVTSLTTSPTSSSLFSDVSFIEEETEDEDTIEFVLDDIDECFHLNDAKEEPNGQTNDDWSYSTPIQSNHSNHNRSFVVEQVSKTETTTTTTTTLTTTTTATTTKDATNNNSILVYPPFFPNNRENSEATNTNRTTELVPKNYYPGSPQRTPMNAQRHQLVLTNQPESPPSPSSCPCCASKERQIEKQQAELQHMNVLVTKLCSLLADTARKEVNANRHNDNQSHLVPLRSSGAPFQNKERALSTTTARKISSLPITSVSDQCPRSRNQRLQVNGEWGTYSGPSISNTKCRARIWQGCVLRFDNGDLYVGSLSRNDTGSLTLYPPGTLYDANRDPKRRLR